MILAPEAIHTLVTHPRVQAARGSFSMRRDEIVELAIAIQQIAAPTGAEATRAGWVREHFVQLGLGDVEIDDVGNVYGRRAGRQGHPGVALAAHLDTVFPAGTDLSVRRERETGRIYGPGLGDNSLGVAGLLALARAMREVGIETVGDVWFVADVGEEGLGNLRGIAAATDRLAGSVSSMIAVEGGGFGTICHQGIGVRRLRIEIRAPGGHAWSDFGAPSAVHNLLLLGAELTALQVPASGPATSFNIGVVRGGTSINTIAQEAHLLLDLRSEVAAPLDWLEEQVTRVVGETRRRAPGEVAIEVQRVGDRPSGSIARDHPLTRLALEALRAVGLPDDGIGYRAGSTDANVPLSRSLPALCLGLTDTENSHRTDEFILPERLPFGLTQLLLVVLGAAGGIVAG